MFSPFCILAFYSHCVRITFSDTAFNDAYFAYALQISSPLYREHFAHAMNYPMWNARDTHLIRVLADWPCENHLLFPVNRLKAPSVCVCVCAWVPTFQRPTFLHCTVQSAFVGNERKASAYIACWKKPSLAVCAP